MFRGAPARFASLHKCMPICVAGPQLKLIAEASPTITNSFDVRRKPCTGHTVLLKNTSPLEVPRGRSPFGVLASTKLNRLSSPTPEYYCTTCRMPATSVSSRQPLMVSRGHGQWCVELTFSLRLPIHCWKLMPWSARSSTNNVCAQSLRLGSPSSRMIYRCGTMILPTPRDL